MINFWKIYEKQSDKRNDYEKEYFDCVVTKGNLKNNTDMEGSHLNHIKHDIADANNVVEPGPINSSRCEPCCRTGKCVGAGCDVTFINYRCNHNPNGHNSHCRRVNRFLCGKCDNESNMTEQEKADAVAYSYDYMEERVSDDDDADADTESDTTFVVEDAQAEDAQAEDAQADDAEADDAQADDVQAEDAQVDDDNTTDTESDTTFVVAATAAAAAATSIDIDINETTDSTTTSITTNVAEPLELSSNVLFGDVVVLRGNVLEDIETTIVDGSRLGIWCDDDQKFIPCTVVRQVKEEESHVLFVLWDDGEDECLDISVETAETICRMKESPSRI
jgi:hypothetical protein